MATLKFSNLILLFTILLLFSSCSKKAEGDEEMKVMIVGTWKRKYNGGTFKTKYEIIEFAADGRYRELKYEGDKDDWNSADSTGFSYVDGYISFEDSLSYYISNSSIVFYSDKPSIYIPGDLKIDWIKPNKLKISNKFDNARKYEKI